jgi:SAM-dependent MidA family methyltransferase
MTPLSHIIREEIAKHGPIPFARFMQLALYCPECGYYEKEKDRVGRGGDFFTSVSVGSLFGDLLAFQFAEWLEAMPEPQRPSAPLKIIEAGAHDGKLAGDILSWLQKHRPKLFSKLEYHILEASRVRRQWQARTLEGFRGKVRWTHDSSDFKGWLDYCRYEPKTDGVIFSNELLDAFPVSRLGWDARAGKWFEWGVTVDNGKFIWANLELKTGWREAYERHMLKLPEPLLAALPDGYVLEIGHRAEAWWADMASVLRRGKLVTIDYGFTLEELISPARVNGTLRAYFQHQVSDDLLGRPGEQDLTAHVNFSSIQEAGERAGLTTELFCRQSQFLTQILNQACSPSPSLKRALGQHVKEQYFAKFDAKQVRQFQTLTHPEHLGRSFQVLVQARG